MNSTPHTAEIGAWRAWLDQEVELPDASAHLETCPGCRRLVDELRADASFAHGGLANLAAPELPRSAEVAVARERVHWRRVATHRKPTYPIRQPASAPVPVFFSRFSTPWRVAAGGIAAALALAVVVAFTPEGSAAAAGFLAQFRSQQVQAIEITPQSQSDIIRALNALNNLGTLQMPSAASSGGLASAARAESQQAHTATLEEAKNAVGILLTPNPATLPYGVSKTPNVRISPGQDIRFTFDKIKAQRYFQSTGHPDVSLPDKFNGASLVVSMPTAALLTFSGDTGKHDEVVLAEAGELAVGVEGNVSLTEMRDFLLGLPGMPAAVVSQLKSIDNWSNTLPIPVPVAQVTPHKDTVNGNDALVLDDNSGIGSAAIWHANGHLIGVAGTLKYTDLKKVADSLAVR